MHDKNYDLLSTIIPNFALPNGGRFLKNSIHFTSISELHYYIIRLLVMLFKTQYLIEI